MSPTKPLSDNRFKVTKLLRHTDKHWDILISTYDRDWR